MTRLAASKAKMEFSKTLDRVASKRERIVLHRRGKDVAVLVPIEDLAVLEQGEAQNRLDAKEARRRLKNRNEIAIPYDKTRTRRDSFDEEPLSSADLKEIRKGLEDIRLGRVISLAAYRRKRKA